MFVHFLPLTCIQIMEPDIKLFCTVVGAEISAQKGGKIICFRIVWIVITFLLKIILQADNKNWYCNLGILHTEHLKNPQVQNRNLADWKKEGLIHEVFTTSQQPDCRWDDHVEMYVLLQFYRSLYLQNVCKNMCIAP